MTSGATIVCVLDAVRRRAAVDLFLPLDTARLQQDELQGVPRDRAPAPRGVASVDGITGEVNPTAFAVMSGLLVGLGGLLSCMFHRWNSF